jgi:hypothetical protein
VEEISSSYQRICDRKKMNVFQNHKSIHHFVKIIEVCFYKNTRGHDIFLFHDLKIVPKKNIFFLIYFFTAEISHFLGQKIQKHLFSKNNIFQNYFCTKIFFSFFVFLLKDLITFWGHKIQKNIFVQTILEKNVFFRKKMFFNFLFPKSD